MRLNTCKPNSTWTAAALLCAALLAAPVANALTPALTSALSKPPVVKAPTWVGTYQWQMRMQPHSGDPFRLRLGFTALPSGDWTVAGSLVLDDAELGASGTARLRDGRLVVDLLVSGGVRDVVPDEGKLALFPPGKAPQKISSAGFATLRLELDPKDYRGVAAGYMINVVNGNLQQGPYYTESTLVPEAVK